MENYSFWADLLHTFRVMSDEVKILLIYMPCVFALGFTALYMHHLRRLMKIESRQPKPYTILPPEKTLRNQRLHPSIETLRSLDEFVTRDKSRGDGGRR